MSWKAQLRDSAKCENQVTGGKTCYLLPGLFLPTPLSSPSLLSPPHGSCCLSRSPSFPRPPLLLSPSLLRTQAPSVWMLWDLEKHGSELTLAEATSFLTAVASNLGEGMNLYFPLRRQECLRVTTHQGALRDMPQRQGKLWGNIQVWS